MTNDYYMIRTSKSHYYSCGSGQYATPKLYSKGHATRWCKKLNTLAIHPDDGPWEVVPVTLTIGAPL